MEKNTVLNGNKLIAEFMNINLNTGFGSKDSQYKYAEKISWLWNDEYYENTLHFHESWDWLIPVVEKIENLGYYFQINTKMCSVARDNKGNNDSYLIKAKFGDETKLQKTYICVIETIKYINFKK